MTRRPQKPGTPILSKFLISRMVMVALTMAILTLSMYAFYSSKYGHAYGQTIAFGALVVMQWANALCTRSEDESIFTRLKVINGKFYAGLIIAITFQVLALFGPLGGLLHIVPVGIGDLVVTGTLAFIIPVVFVEIHKFIGRRFYGRDS